MKAIIFRRYGPPDVCELAELERPVPGPKQVLVEVRAASINAKDSHLRSADVAMIRLMGMGLFRPKDQRLGTDLAGRVAAVGSEATRFKLGDEVFGFGHGSFAEYACADEDLLARKPSGASFEAAAALPIAALTALQALRDKGRVESGQRVAIQGASGGVGGFAVQLAKCFGAEVTAVCSSRNLDMARSLGADRVVDYARVDFAAGDPRYDLILGINGYRPIRDYRRALAAKGCYVWVGAASSRLMPAMLQSSVLGPLYSKEGGQRLLSLGAARANSEDLAFLGELLGAGKIKSIIDRTYPLAETAAAFRHFEYEHARGKVVISLA
jgi:NADPH:quinone reductase-like Zn-dependent oxidoreductase